MKNLYIFLTEATAFEELAAAVVALCHW